MSTRIVFDSGLNLVVQQDEEDVVDALAAVDDDEPVVLKSRSGRMWKVHPRRVVLIEALRQGPPALA